MCLICVEFDKLTTVELRRNFDEMKGSLGDHAQKVEDSIVDRELREVIETFNEEFDRLFEGLFLSRGTVSLDDMLAIDDATRRKYGKKSVNSDYYGLVVLNPTTGLWNHPEEDDQWES